MKERISEKIKETLSKIEKIRVSKGYTEELIADKMHISQPSFNRIKNGKQKLTLDILYAIAEALEVPITDIMVL